MSTRTDREFGTEREADRRRAAPDAACRLDSTTARESLRIVVLEPWLGGSHERFLDGWRRHTRHALDVRGLPARHWKWRMESGAWALARELDGPPPDVLVCSDYVDLSRLSAFLPPAWRSTPTLLYFHENQLSYPLRPGETARERDLAFGFANVASCLVADAIAFNSRFHLDEFRAAANALLRALPKPSPRAEFERAIECASVVPPGVELDALPLGGGAPTGAPLRVSFAHRWEHDKDPAAFLRALGRARDAGARFELVLLGESFDQLPTGVADGLAAHEPRVLQRGFASDRGTYARWLACSDLSVSTARHEFFGLATVEALAAGCTPLLPRRLAYPEVVPVDRHADALYDDEDRLVERLVAHAAEPAALRDPTRRAAWRAVAGAFDERTTAERLDAACERLARR